MFDSTGIAIEDMAVAKFLFEKTQQMGGYPSIDLIRNIRQWRVTQVIWFFAGYITS